MDFYPFLVLLRDTLAFPVALLFLFVAVFLTIKTRFIQFRAGKKFIQLVTKGPESHGSDDIETINPFHALFTSMSTTIGMGNIIAPPLAIITGGPGALFWLVVYCFFASATKYVEVTLAVKFRSKAKDGAILGGPTEYLKKLNPFLGRSYGFITIFLFAAWAALQANSLGEIFSKHHVPTWATGVGLAILIFFVLKGGAKRVGIISSRLVPVMFVIYVSCSLFILLKDPSSLFNSVSLVLSCAFSPAATVGGFLGATVMAALRDGVARGVYITECGIGTSSVAHAVADVKKPTDQGVLALYSVVADVVLCLVSGLLVLVSGVWRSGRFSNMLMFEVFDHSLPYVGYYILLVTLFLFVLTTLIGNSFNGGQSYSSFTRHRYMKVYYLTISAAIFFGAIVQVPIMWTITDLMVFVISVPHLIGISILAFRYKKSLIFNEKK